MKHLLLFVCSIHLLQAGAQSYKLEWKSDGNLKPTKTDTRFKSVQAAMPFIKKHVNQLHAAGYWMASCDSVYLSDSTTITALLHTGDIYTYGTIKWGNIPGEIKHEAGLRNMDNKKAQPVLLEKNANKLLTWCEDNGFPFATVTWDSVPSS